MRACRVALLLSCVVALSLAQETKHRDKKKLEERFADYYQVPDLTVERVSEPQYRLIGEDEYFDGEEGDAQKPSKPHIQSKTVTIVLGRGASCFYKEVAKDSHLVVAMQVLRGGNEKAWLHVREVGYKVKDRFKEEPDKKKSTFVKVLSDTTYEICVMGAERAVRVVSLEIHTLTPQKSPEHQNEPPSLLDGNIGETAESISEDIADTLEVLEENMMSLMMYLGKMRARARRDAFTRTDMYSLVNLYSLALCLTVVLVQTGEVVMIRRMFHVKPRHLRVGL